jgi:hypothetical protein
MLNIRRPRGRLQRRDMECCLQHRAANMFEGTPMFEKRPLFGQRVGSFASAVFEILLYVAHMLSFPVPGDL